MHICAETADLDIHNYVEELFPVERLGTVGCGCYSEFSKTRGPEDQRARRILQVTPSQKANRINKTRLLWKYDAFDFSDSRPMAERRLKFLERRLAKKPLLYDSVRQQIADYQSNGAGTCHSGLYLILTKLEKF